jgi:RNA polymerase sigma factor (sigma-70 family)
LIQERESVSDVVQSACREALVNLSSFEYQGEGAFKHWLFTIALRKITARLRLRERRKLAGALELTIAQDPSDSGGSQLWQGYAQVFSPSQYAVRREEAERIEWAFEQLEDDQREIVLLSRVIGLSRKQIADEMHRSEEAVKKLLARALAHFARIVSGGADECSHS